MNIMRVENRLIIVSEPVGIAVYDFVFDLHFSCSHPHRFDREESCVLRIGAISDYATVFRDRLNQGLRLINSPEEYLRASELEGWYPLISEMTPRTRIFEELPSADGIEQDFTWPIFMKGSRQTSKHNPDLSVIESREHYARAVQQYRSDAILSWQKPVVREFVQLMPVSGSVPGKVRPSVEYRSFWWFGECVGWGCYWYQIPPYESADIDAGLAVARQASKRVNVPFLVVDFAKTMDGRWIVIECNDAQEAGYAGVSPHLLWRRVLEQIG